MKFKFRSFKCFKVFGLPWLCACAVYLCFAPRIGCETLLSGSEGTPVPSSTQLNQSVKEFEGNVVETLDVTPTVLEPGLDVVFTQVESSHVDSANEIINNDTPIVISRDVASEELQKRAEILTPEILEIKETVPVLANATSVEQNATEDIPSFSEWTQKRLEEAEKNQQVNLSSSNPSTNTSAKNTKVRWKNYAAVDCGAKVVLANPEAQHTWAILVGSRDEYALNPCSSRIWFIVELCEAIQLKKVELANYELFSSSPREFSVFVSDRFPSRDWVSVGQFTAEDRRDVQDFYVETDTFGKYVKVEIKSHYGSEHYCPLSLFRAYGTSVFEVLQKDDPAHQQRLEEDDDDDVLDLTETVSSNNLLSSATDAVISMVKKAAQVLGNKVVKANESTSAVPVSKELVQPCNSPSHYIICTNCSEDLFARIFNLLSCRQLDIWNLLSIPAIRHSLEHSTICQAFGLDFQNTPNSQNVYLQSFFPSSFLGAMCNALAVTHQKTLYNTTYHFPNTTKEIVLETLEPQEPGVDHQPTEPLPEINTKSGCSTDTTYAAQIKPTKSLVTELPEVNTSQVVAEQPEDATGSGEVNLEVEGASDGAIDVQSEVVEEIADSGPAVSVPSIQGQKESVFLRLSNRIKALERNMSLSGQYLEELSKRYKKQVEEMQRVMEKTETTLRDVSLAKDERLKRLEDRLEHLTRSVEALSAEKDNWKSLVWLLVFAMGATFLGYGYQRIRTPRANRTLDQSHSMQRRNSVDVVIPLKKKKKRRPSDQALKIVASSASGDSRKRKKKTSFPTRKEETFTPVCTSSRIDWVEGRGRVIEDVPFPLEEADSWVEGLPPLGSIEPPGYVKTARQFRLGRSSLPNGVKEEQKKRHSSPPGSVDAICDHSPKKERKGFRKLLKKVF